MALSIKNEKVDRLVRELAELTQESFTDAIMHALEERLVRLKGRRSPKDTVHDILSISRRCASLPDLDTRSPEEILGYDDDGVPGGD